MSNDEINWSHVIGELAADVLNGAKQYKQHHRDKVLALLQQCQEHDIPPPTKLIDLIASIIGDERRNALPSAQDLEAAGLGRVGNKYEAEYIERLLADGLGVSVNNRPKLIAAAKFEAQHPADPTGDDPSTASGKRIAETSGLARATVRGYRNKEKYRALVKEYRDELAKGGNHP